MVTKVYGKINSCDVIFTNVGGDFWETEVPINVEGIWITALWAENDSGSKAYICKILIAISDHQMKIVVVPDGYQVGEVKERGYQGEYILCNANTSR